VKDILLNIFSAEWIEQHNGSRSLTLQELDIASRLTSGFIDQARHCVSDRATHAFRLSFLSFLLLILLNGLGPSAVSVDPVPYDYSRTIQVANLTIGVPGEDAFLEPPDLFASHRANLVLQLETAGNLTAVGFSARKPNVLIPWPSSSPMSKNVTMRYQSDVIRYNFSCSWKVPSIYGPGVWRVTDSEWRVQLTDNVLPSWPGVGNPCEPISS
jgi:hypothetical protein